MEIKINKEICDYQEAIFFGLSLRQLLFSMLACGAAVGLYFLLRPYLGLEILSWMCIVGAAPFAALGFVTYHGMTAEQLFGYGFGRNFWNPRGSNSPAPPCTMNCIEIEKRRDADLC